MSFWRLFHHGHLLSVDQAWRPASEGRTAAPQVGRAAERDQRHCRGACQGDLSENAEYESAKERQSFIEGRIAELEGKLSAAQIIDPAALDADGRVVFGATVQLEDIDSGDKVTYQIVGEDEADLKLSKISVASPLARALIGKYAGDVASFQAPGGEREYEILDVLYR